MANKKITELNNLQTPVANTQFVAVDIENDETKSVTLANLISVIDTNENQNVVQIQANVTSLVDTGGHTLTISANLIPDADGVYDLGSSSAKWKDLHLTGSSIKLGGITISDLGNEGFTITGTSGQQANITTPALGGVANVALELSDLQARLTTNVTTFTNEDTALQSRLATNVTTFTNEDTALQSRLTTNVTAFTNEDTALQARITANNTLAASNDFITYTRLNANIDLVQDNVASIADATAAETRLNANLDIVSDNAAAVETRRVANIAGAISTVLTGDLTVSRALASDSSGKISVATTTLAELNHVNGVTSAIQTQLDAVEARRAANNITTTFTDDVIVTGNLTVNGATTTINTTNMDVDDTMIMLANGTTGSPANDIGILFNRGDEGNAAFFYDESSVTFKLSDTKDPKSNTALSPVTAANLSVGILEVGEEMTMTSTDDGSSAGPVIILDRQSASPADADYLGRIQFKGKDDGGANDVYSQISGKIIDASAGVENGAIEFSIRSAGSNLILLRQRHDKLQLLNGNELTVDGDASFSKNADIDGNLTIGTNSSNTVTITGSIDLGALS